MSLSWCLEPPRSSFPILNMEYICGNYIPTVIRNLGDLEIAEEEEEIWNTLLTPFVLLKTQKNLCKHNLFPKIWGIISSSLDDYLLATTKGIKTPHRRHGT